MMPPSREELRQAYGGQQLAERYVADRFTTELNRLLHDRQVAAIRRLMDRVRPRRVLEVAPGPGRLTREVRPAGLLACVEYSEAMISEGRFGELGSAAWVRGNAFQLPFGQCFELVYSFRLVRHFRLEDRKRLYGEIQRVLKSGGYFLMDAVNARVSRPLRVAHPQAYPMFDELYEADELRAELAAAGLEPLELEPVQRWYRGQYCSQVLLGPRLNQLNRLVIRWMERLPRREGLEWIVTCRRA